MFVNDRGNHRIQVFDENGKYLYEWYMGDVPSDVHLIYIGARPQPVAFDPGSSKMLKYDLQGHSCIPGARGEISPADSGASTVSASIRKATSTSLKWIAVVRRSSNCARVRIRRSW